MLEAAALAEPVAAEELKALAEVAGLELLPVVEPTSRKPFLNDFR